MTETDKYHLVQLLIECIDTIEAAKHCSPKEKEIALRLVENKKEYINKKLVANDK